MKRFIYTIIVLAIVPFMLNARTSNLSETGPDKSANKVVMQLDRNMAPTYEVANQAGKDNFETLLGNQQYKAIITNVDAGWNSYGDYSPFSYDPVSNTLGIVQSRYYRSANYDVDSLLESVVKFYYSNDNGNTWTTKTIDSSSDVFVNTSFSMSNPNNTTDPNKLNIMVFGRIYTSAKDYMFDACNWLIINGSANTKERFPEAYPTGNNDGTNLWMLTKTISTKDMFYVYGRLEPKSDAFGNILSQYGSYGLGRTDVDLNLYNSDIPKNWKYDNFYVAPGNLGSTYNDRMYMDADNQGNIYAAFNNILVGAETSAYLERTPLVQKSTDKGTTWSTFDKVPFQTIKDFLAEFGGKTDVRNSSFNVIHYVRTYSASAFAVTGVDQYSYVYRFLRIKSADTIDLLLAEATKRPGQPWKFNGISMIPLIITSLTDTTGGRQAVPVDIFDPSEDENEIHLAKTADGQNLIVKWVDYAVEGENGIYCKWDTPAYTTNGNVGMNPNLRIDSMLTSDVFMAYRELGSDEWTNPINVTNDKWFNKITFMPSVVKDLNNVPLMEYAVRSFKNQTYTAQNKNYIRANSPYNYPVQLQNRITERNVLQDIVFGMVDLKNPVSLSNQKIMPDKGDVNSVEEFVNTKFEITGISPNPATTSADISYVLKSNAVVSIEIYNSMGQMVKSVFEGNLNEGIYGQNVNISDVATGTYYVTFTINGKRTAKLLNVVR